MRCNNCGWENPPNKIKCEKCNAPLDGSMAASAHPRVNEEKQAPSENFNNKSGDTVRICPKPGCGYLLRVKDTECPMCGDNKVKPEPDEPETKKCPYCGCLLGGSAFSKGTVNLSCKKLVGFLVTYNSLQYRLTSPCINYGSSFPLFSGRNSIGSGSSNDIVIPDKAVSKEHLVVAYYPQDKKFRFSIAGLTQNGTHINDKFYPDGGGELENYDVIVIGSTKLTLVAIPEIAIPENAFV